MSAFRLVYMMWWSMWRAVDKGIEMADEGLETGNWELGN